MRGIMGMDKRKSRLLSVIILTMFFFGCAETPKPVKKPDLFSEWQTKAEQSEGHSPPPRAKKIEAPETVKRPPKEEAALKPEKRLPTQKVSLRMHNADIVVVLRALARSVGQNILINDKVKGLVNVDIEAIPWDQAFLGILRLQGLSYAWEGDILRVLAVEDMENELRILETRLKNSTVRDKEKAMALESRQIEPLSVTVVPVDYANAVKLQEQLKEYLTKDEKGTARGSITVDEHTNSLVMNAIREDVDKLVPLVKKLDKPTPQIMIQSNIVQTTKDTAFRLGIQWGGFYNTTGGGVHVTPGGTGVTPTSIPGVPPYTYTPLTGSTELNLTNPTGIGQQGFAVNLPVDVMSAGGSALGLMFGTIGGNILDIQLMALQREGKLNILSSPSITTLDNQMAFTENGEKIPYVSTSGLSGTQVQFQDAVLRLEITPHVITEDVLKMKIVVKNDQVDPTRTVLGNPYIIKKQTDTTLICKDGETIVISGLTKITTQDVDKGVPGLRDTPLFKWLFSSVDDNKKMEDVLIFITPHILKQWYDNGAGKS
jgi:type IV pilus assembly protein PilQ